MRRANEASTAANADRCSISTQSDEERWRPRAMRGPDRQDVRRVRRVGKNDWAGIGGRRRPPAGRERETYAAKGAMDLMLLTLSGGRRFLAGSGRTDHLKGRVKRVVGGRERRASHAHEKAVRNEGMDRDARDPCSSDCRRCIMCSSARSSRLGTRELRRRCFLRHIR
jgi:hypothetical protein